MLFVKSWKSTLGHVCPWKTKFNLCISIVSSSLSILKKTWSFGYPKKRRLWWDCRSGIYTQNFNPDNLLVDEFDAHCETRDLNPWTNREAFTLSSQVILYPSIYSSLKRLYKQARKTLAGTFMSHYIPSQPPPPPAPPPPLPAISDNGSFLILSSIWF